MRVEAGRLTRSLASPAKLQPTAERGELALWLLPNDDLALTWQAPLPAQAAPTSAVSTTVPSSSGGHIGEAGGGGSQQVACGLAVWEALAHFPEHAFSESEEPGEGVFGPVVPRLAEPPWHSLGTVSEMRETQGISEARGPLSALDVTPYTPALPCLQWR